MIFNTDLLTNNNYQNNSTYESELIEEIVDLVKNEDTKTLQTIITQIRLLLSFKNQSLILFLP